MKIGTNILAPNAVPDIHRIETIASDIAKLKEDGFIPIVVSSGAIGFGALSLKISSKPTKVSLKQACAAVGQPILMQHWQEALGKHQLIAAQVLLSRKIFDDRQSFLNLKNAVENLLELGCVPILNENDSVSTTEIGDVFGDNDSLSAHVASKLDADLLVLLTDVNALYDRDPHEYDDAKPINLVEKITPEIQASAGKAGSKHAVGGMKTKIQAVEIASRAGCCTVLADGRKPGNLLRILAGEEEGTLFLAGQRIGARARWILGARTKGNITVDEGALLAIDNRKSLLPKGVKDVEGVFSAGDVISINDRYKAVSSMNSEEIRSLKGQHSREVRKILGSERREEVVRADDIVISTN